MKKHFLITAICVAAIAYTTMAQWISNGPNGAVHALAVIGTSIFAGTNTGAYLSSDNGSTWTAVNTGLPTNTQVLSYAVSGTKIFAGTYGAAYLSSNNGATWWQAKAGLPSNYNVTAMAVCGSTIFAGTDGYGTFLSTNNGTSWQDATLNLDSVHSFGVSGVNVFIGTNNGIRISSNNGISWSTVNTGLPANTTVTALTVNGSRIFAGTNNGGIFLSSNNGANWSAVNAGLPTNAIVNALTVSGTTIFVHTSNGMYVSNNNGGSWSAANSGFPANTIVNALTVSSSSIFAGTNGGMYSSGDNGTNWSAINAGVSPAGRVYALSASGNNMYAGTINGIYLSGNNGTNWVPMGTSWPSRIAMYALATSGDTIYAGTDYGIYLSHDQGNSWSQVNIGYTGHIYVILVSGSNIYAGTDYGVYLSNDNGNTWSLSSNGLSTPNVLSLAVSGSNIFAGTSNGIYMSGNNGTNWIAITGLPYGMSVNALTINNGSVYAGSGFGVYEGSSYSGCCWSSYSYGMPFSFGIPDITVYSFAVKDTDVYAGTDKGVYLSRKGAFWSAVNTGLPGSTMVNGLAVNDTFIFAGANNVAWPYGNERVWQMPIPPAPANDDPCNATALSVNTTCNYITANNAGATNSSGVPAPGCGNYNGGDIWYKFIVPLSGHVIAETQQGAVVTDGAMAMYSGNCNGGLSLIACNDDQSASNYMPMLEQTGLVPGSTVYIRLWAYYNAAAGTFPLCVYDTPACTSPSISNQTNVSCFRGNNGSATVSAVGGLSPYSYAWDNGQTTATASNLINGTYTVSVTSANGCSGTATVTITEPQPTASITASKSTSLCGTDSVMLTASGGTGYVWNTGTSAQSIFAKATGTYVVTVTSAAGCSSTTDIPVTLYSAPAVLISSAKNAICQGESLTLNATTGFSAYTWNTGTVGADNITVTPTMTTTYTVTISDLNGCTASTQQVITVNPLPQAIITAGGATTFCQGDSLLLTANTANGYFWSTTETTQSIMVKNSGSYSVVTSNSQGCSQTSAVIVVTVNPKPAAPVIANSGATCEGGTVSLLASNINGASYSWNGPNGYTSALQNPVLTNVSVSQAGTYTCVVSVNGCQSDPASTVVVINKSTVLFTLQASGATTFCQGDNVILTAKVLTDTTGLHYLWSNGKTTPSITVKTNGNYSAVITDSNGCSMASNAPASITVTVHPLPAKPVITKNGNTLTSSASAGNQWFENNVMMNGENNQTLIISNKGTYKVRVTDANGCTNESDSLRINSLVGIHDLSADALSFTMYPNPYTDATQITYTLTHSSPVFLEIYNLLGEHIEVVVDNELQVGGKHEYAYASPSTGVYIVMLKTSNGVVTQKLVRAK